MIKILIDLTPLYARKITGVEVYGIEFYQALKKTGYEIYPVFRMQNTLDNNPNAIIIKCKSRLIVENISLSKILKRLKPQIAFFPIFPPPIDVYTINGVKIIPVIHDLAFKFYSATLSIKARLYLVPKYILALKYSNAIITISETIKSEISQTCTLPVYNWGNNISSVYKLGKDYVFKSLILHKYDIKEYEYLVSVSTLEPRKNILYLLDVFSKVLEKKSNMKLLLVGRHGWNNSIEFEKKISKLGGAIIFTGYIETEDLINLYHYSKAFILLSLYEGFGRTPLEALMCGAKVLVSDIPIFHETLGKQARYINLDNINSSTNQLLSYIDAVSPPIDDTNKLFDKLEKKLIDGIEILIDK